MTANERIARIIAGYSRIRSIPGHPVPANYSCHTDIRCHARSPVPNPQSLLPLCYTSPMTIRYTTFLLLTLALTGFIGYGTFATARLLRTWRPERNLLLLPQENALRFLLVFVCIGLGILSGVEPSALGWRWENWQVDALLGLGIGLALAFSFYAGTRLLLRLGGGRFYSPSVLEILLPTNRREFWLVLLAFVPAVLLEELLFRSLLIGGLAPLIAPLALILVGGVAFGLLHSPQGLWGMVGAGLAGVIFGLLFLTTGSLVAPLVAHYVANSVQIGLAMKLSTQLSPG